MPSTPELRNQVASRAAAARNGNNTVPTAEQRAEMERLVDPAQTLRADIERMKPEFQKAMPRGMEAAMLVRDAWTALRKVPKLADCDTESVLGGLMTIAQLGLRPHVLGQAFVLPYYSSRDRAYHAQFVLGYPGIVELGMRSDRVKDIAFRPVYENDTFDIDYIADDVMSHKPAKRGPRGEAVAYYAIIRLKDGGRTVFYMTKEDAQFYRDLYASSRNKQGEIIGPWRDNFDSMAGKSCLKQGSKTMPKGPDLAIAMVADEGVRFDLNPKNDAASVTGGLNVVDGHVVERDDAPMPPEPTDEPPAD